MDGVAMTKTLTHKRLIGTMQEPTMLFIDTPLQYQRLEGKYSSLEPQILQVCCCVAFVAVLFVLFCSCYVFVCYFFVFVCFCLFSVCFLFVFCLFFVCFCLFCFPQ